MLQLINNQVGSQSKIVPLFSAPWFNPWSSTLPLYLHFHSSAEHLRVRTTPLDSIFINQNWISFLRKIKMEFLSNCQIKSCKSCTTVIWMCTCDWLVRLCSHSEGHLGIEVENWLWGQFQKLCNLLEFGFWFASELNQIGTAFWLSWIIEIEFLKSTWNRMKIGFQKGHGTDPKFSQSSWLD